MGRKGEKRLVRRFAEIEAERLRVAKGGGQGCA
jgi:hypothetical protein